MKSLICSLVLVLCSFFLRAQTTTLAYPVKTPVANGPTTEGVTNAMYGKFIIYSYDDTTSANADSYIKHQAFSFISTVSPIALWYRDLTNQIWLQLSVSGSPTVSSWLTRGNDLSGQSLPNRLGTKNGDLLNIITSDLIRMIIPAGGIVRSSSAQNKFLVIDTVGKEIYYTDGGGTTPTWQQTLTAGSTLTTTNTVESTTFPQFWNWTGLTQNAFIISAATTAAIPGQTLFSVSLSGANAAAGRTTYATQITNSHTGTTSSNYGSLVQVSGAASANYGVNTFVTGTAINNYSLYANAYGGTNNYGLYVASGDVNLQPQTASRFVTLDANKNMTSSAVASSILAASLSDETGTDKVVFNTSPSFVTSVIGGASFDAFNTVSTTLNIGGAATTLTIGGTPTTAITHNYSTNATAAATTKTINLGTGGAASSTTNINIGSANGGTTTVNSPTLAATIFNASTGFRIGGAATSRKMLVGNGTNFVASTETWAVPGTSGNVLTSDGTNWISAAPAGGMAIGGSITSATQGSVLFAGASGVLAQDNSNLFWDNTNKRLAIGSTTTTFDIDVRKTTDGSVGFGVQNASGGTSAAAVFQLGRSYGADYYVSHYYAGDGNTVYTPLSYNIINASGSTGGMNLVNIANASMTFGTSNTTRMTISGAGAVRMHTYGAGAATFDASGNITSVSDIRLKNIQGYYGVGLKQLMQINPIVYKWKPSSGMETKHDYIGFSAQNIRSSLGEDAIGINKQGYLSIQDRAILAVAINAIQELKELNDKQQKEINNLKQIIKNK